MTDKSELYRLMCEKAPEMQEKHEREVLVIGLDDMAPPVISIDNFLPDIRWFLEHIEGVIDISRNFKGKYCTTWGAGKTDTFIIGKYYPSPEMSLLEVYMHANHGKKWSGKEWAK